MSERSVHDVLNSTLKTQYSKEEKRILAAYIDRESEGDGAYRRGSGRFLAKKIFWSPARFVLALLARMVATGAALCLPYLFGRAVDESLIPKNWEALPYFVLAYFVFDLIRFVFGVWSQIIFVKIGQKVMQNLRVEVFSHLQRLPVSSFDRTPSGKLVTRVTNDISALNDLFSSGIVGVLAQSMVMFGALAVLFVLDWRLAFVSLSLFPVMVYLTIYFSRKMRDAHRNARSKLSGINAFVAETILGIKELHAFGRVDSFLDRFELFNRWYTDARKETLRTFAMFRPTTVGVVGASVSLLLWYGGYLSMEKAIPVGLLVSFFAYVMQLYQPIQDMADQWGVFQAGMVSAERIMGILSWEEEEDLGQVALPVDEELKLDGKIEFKNVWFAYENENWILRDLSFVIEPGQKVGIAGPSGAGKTSLVQLLLRFYDIQKGQILIDGVDIKKYPKRVLRAAMGLIQQDIHLFSGSLRENVSLWRSEGKTAPELLFQQTGYDPLVDRLDEPIQERGENLSTGQRQVVAFARAAFAEPSVWILDEATAHMDSDSEKRMDGLLEKHSSEKTTIVIAHRLASIRDADQILVLNQGNLAELGSHEELMKEKGLYARLQRYQESAIGQWKSGAKESPEVSH